MGQIRAAQCNACGARFNLDSGGGFLFHLLRCNHCGESSIVNVEQLGELHIRYLKGCAGFSALPPIECDASDLSDFEGEPISEEDYRAAVEERAGTCGCGGRFRFDAPPRCPECRSTDIAEGEVMMYLD